MANVSFKKSNTINGSEFVDAIETFPLNEGTIYVTKDHEMYLDENADRVMIGGNLTYQDLENEVNPDNEGTPPTFGGHTIDEFVLSQGDEMYGYLTLCGDPIDDLHAATKQYVDNLTPEIYRDYVIILNNNTSIIDIPSRIKDLNNLMVYQNGLLLNEYENYEIDEASKTISLIEYTAKQGEVFTFTGPTYANSNAGSSSGNTSNGSNIILAKTLAYNNWNSFQQSISVPEVVASSSQQFISISPTYSSINDYAKFEIQCISQQQGLLKFSCSSVPNVNIMININIQNV